MSDAAALAAQAAAGNGTVPWHQDPEFGEELRNYAIGRKWDQLEAGAAAREATKAHREASALLRVPQERILRLPETEADPGWAEVYQRLGAPKDPSGYNFEGLKLGDGTPAPVEITEAMRAVAVKHHLTATAASEIAATALGAVEQGQNAAASARATQEKAELDQEWGPNKARNVFFATQAAEALGLGADFVEGIQGARGYKAIMKGLAGLGPRMGEAPMLLGDGSAGASGSMTPQQATEAMAARMKDSGFYAKWRAGDADAVAEWARLNRLSIVPR